MQLNNSTDYALRMLLYLATVNRMANAQEIAKEMSIPPKYVASLVKKLKDAKFIATFRGSSGGYVLDCEPKDISLQKVFDVMEGGLKIKSCTRCDPTCCLFDGRTCPLSKNYDFVQNALRSILEATTLQDLIHKEEDMK